MSLGWRSQAVSPQLIVRDGDTASIKGANSGQPICALFTGHSWPALVANLPRRQTMTCFEESDESG
jgi:hypothetical protein